MDILIKNMELPKDDEHGFILVFTKGLVVDFTTNKVVKAIEVPPHGRLTDADVIRELLTKDCPCKGCDNYHEEGICMQCQWDRFVQIIQQAPTALEATE